MASHDVGWDTFRHEFRHWMELRRMTNRQLAQRLRDVMREEADAIDEYIVKRWRHSTSPPLRALRHIAEILCMSEDSTGSSAYDPSYLLRRMGLLDQGAGSAELFDTAYRLQELRLRLMDVRSQLSERTARTGAGHLVQLAMSHGYGAVAYPVWEGPAGYPMHVADRLDFRPTEPGVVPLDSHPDMRAALTTNFAVRDEPAPYSNDGVRAGDETTVVRDDSDNAVGRGDERQCRWSVPLIGRPVTRLGHTLHPRITAVTVSSTTTDAWPDKVGAILAWVLGYAFVSTHEVARELTGEPLSVESLRNDIHAHFLAQSPRCHVWSHHAMNLDPTSPWAPWASADHVLDPHLVHFRLVEDDALLENSLQPRIATELASRPETGPADLAELRDRRDEVLRRCASEELSDARERLVTVDVTRFEDPAARWEQVLQCVLAATVTLDTIGTVADLTATHERFVREEPDVAPSILAWLADHACPLVDPRFASRTAQ